MTQQRISLFKLFNESNSLQVGGNPERQVREVRYDADTQEVRITYPGCFGWAVFKEQLCPCIDNGVIVVAEGFLTNDPQAGYTAHLLFMHQGLDPLQHYTIRDRKTNHVIDRVGPPPPPYVYRLEDSDGHRHLVRYEKTESTGLWQRLSVARARLEDDNALRQLLQDTRNMATEDGGGGYYDTEMIWMQKGHQIGSVDGPPIPPIPTELGTLLHDGQNVSAEEELKELTEHLRVHHQRALDEANEAYRMIGNLETVAKHIDSLALLDAKVAEAARSQLVSQLKLGLATRLHLIHKDSEDR